MRLISALIAGGIGGLIGAAIWAGISYVTNYEIGWLAWGVGFLVGLGVRLGAQDWEGVAPGLLAVAVAMLAVVGGKYAAISLHLSHAMADFTMPSVSAQDIQESLAEDIVSEREENKKPVKWAPGKSLDTAEILADYPQDVQKEAIKRWDDLGADEQARRISELKEGQEKLQKFLHGEVHKMAFFASFGVMDAVFFLLAAVTAFRLGSGSATDE